MVSELINRNKRLIVVVLILLTVVIVGYSITIQIQRTGKMPVTIAAVPSDTSVTIDGQKTSSGTFYIKSGIYTVTGSKTGFKDFSQSVYIDHSNQLIPVTLAPVSDEAKKWADKNGEKYEELEAKVGAVTDQEGQDFSLKNPIADILPYSNYLYAIGYSADTSDPSGNSIVIDIDATDGYRQAAVNQIRQWGYDPTSYKINFNDYESPFAL